jgi:molybdopterin molybdotransferase
VASERLAPGEAWRIMTGAAILDGADAVVPFEECEVIETTPQGQRVRFTRAAASGANVRDAGADLGPGDTVFEEGRELSPHDLALLGALGVSRVTIGPRPFVGILSTGDELLDIDAPLRPGAIRDSNTLMLRLLLQETGCVVAFVERLSDDPAQVHGMIRDVSAQCDVTLTIGGISMGDFDPVRQSLDQMRWVEWWRVAMKPGQPQAFGTRGSRLFFGLPGNPASVACVFEALVRPAIRALQGFTELDRPKLAVRAAVAIESRAGRTDFVRVTLAWRDGVWWATPAGAQISGHLTPQARAHGLLIVPEDPASLATGDEAVTLLLRWPRAEGA